VALLEEGKLVVSHGGLLCTVPAAAFPGLALGQSVVTRVGRRRSTARRSKRQRDGRGA
jgi:hypothetical protein